MTHLFVLVHPVVLVRATAPRSLSYQLNFESLGAFFAPEKPRKSWKKRAFSLKNGSLTDFSYNSLISFKILNVVLRIVKNIENLTVKTKVSKYFSLL